MTADWISRFVVRLLFCSLVAAGVTTVRAGGQTSPARACARPAAGSIVPEPEDLESRGGVLNLSLTYRNCLDEHGRTRYAYIDSGGREAPTLRLKPGDLLVLRLENDLSLTLPPSSKAEPAMANHRHSMPAPCGGGVMNSVSTNLHFHGLTVPPDCHQDDVLRTLISPGGPPFEYRLRIPEDEPPGMYWYHPHVHGFTSPQVLGGASGAIVVEGLERANPHLAGLPERVLVIRDQDLINPNAIPRTSGNVPPPIVLRDTEGDILNTGTGEGKPAKDLSINFVPVPFPDYKPAVIPIRPGERQLWRVLNASAITYLNLQVLVKDAPQLVGVVSLDGVPLREGGRSRQGILWESHILLPPAGRVEFVVKGPASGEKASLVTRSVDTGPDGENDPTRPLATLLATPGAPEPLRHLDVSPQPLPPPPYTWLGDVTPAHERKLYFSEHPHDPRDPASPTDFYITVDGQAPKLFDPASTTPNLTVRQGDVEDWIIENRTRELHAFHIHQTHFLLLEYNGVPLDEPYLRDTVNVSYWDGKSRQYPSVKLRIDFRDPDMVGTFPYHCHLLEHEDGGMMGTIRVLPALQSTRQRLPAGGGF